MQQFWQSHKKAEKPLRRWIKVTENTTWNCFNDVRKTFNHADSYKQGGKKYVIFNVGGNKYRLITAIRYGKKLVVVAVALTHGQYDTNRWKAKL